MKKSPDQWRAIAAAYAAFVFVASVAPIPPSAPTGLYLDKIAHLGLYLLLGWLLLRAWRIGGSRPGDVGAVWAAATAYGALIELVQAMVPWRSAEWADLLMNAVGAALGVWAGHRMTKA